MATRQAAIKVGKKTCGEESPLWVFSYLKEGKKRWGWCLMGSIMDKFLHGRDVDPESMKLLSQRYPKFGDVSLVVNP